MPAAENEEVAPEEGVVEAEEAVATFSLAEDECYPDDHVEKAFQDSMLSRRSMRFYECLG